MWSAEKIHDGQIHKAFILAMITKKRVVWVGKMARMWKMKMFLL
jgi:hypothetical protein